MARTKAEIRAFLESKVNTRINDKSNSELNGQCVTLIKALFEFLGVANPYAGRGNAKDAGDAYIRQGIGSNGRGWLTVVVSRTMGVVGGTTYGHIWVNLTDEANYEQNGARALTVTKNTRPLSQGQQFINLDKWIGEENVSRKAIPPEIVSQHYANFTAGLVKVSANDPAAQNRFEDTEDDEFWYGLCFQLKDLLNGQYHRANGLEDSLEGERKGYEALLAENKKLKEQLAAGGSDQYEQTVVYVKKGK